MLPQQPILGDTSIETGESVPEPNEFAADASSSKTMPPEFGGREGPDPTRYGDWEKNGRCIDF